MSVDANEMLENNQTKYSTMVFFLKNSVLNMTHHQNKQFSIICIHLGISLGVSQKC
jgi:hypothetical protein